MLPHKKKILISNYSFSLDYIITFNVLFSGSHPHNCFPFYELILLLLLVDLYLSSFPYEAFQTSGPRRLILLSVERSSICYHQEVICTTLFLFLNIYFYHYSELFSFPIFSLWSLSNIHFALFLSMRGPRIRSGAWIKSPFFFSK